MAFLTPPLTVTQATWLATYFACSYVGSIYVSKNSRLSFSKSSTTPPGVEQPKQSNERGRDDPDVIRARLLAVSIATISSCIACYVVLLKLAVCFLSPVLTILTNMDSAIQLESRNPLGRSTSPGIHNTPSPSFPPSHSNALPGASLCHASVPGPTIPFTMDYCSVYETIREHGRTA